MVDESEMIEVPGYGKVSRTLRRHWVNVVSRPDASILEIDALEDGLRFMSDVEKSRAYEIRQAITRFEWCHHKALHRLHLLVRSIGELRYIAKPSSPEEKRADRDVKQWFNALRILRAWVDNDADSVDTVLFCGIPSAEFVSHIGERNPLKEWQVSRLADRLQYDFLNFDKNEGEYIPFSAGSHSICSNEEETRFYDQTVGVKILDTQDGNPREWDLGTAIDWFALCCWNYSQNLVTILQVIQGQSHLDVPLIQCGQDFVRHPNYRDFVEMKHALRAYWDVEYHWGIASGDKPSLSPKDIFDILGEKSAVKIWLVRSLERTLSFPVSV